MVPGTLEPLASDAEARDTARDIGLPLMIKAAVVSGYFYGYRESLLVKHQNCSCNYVPHLYETADMGDLGALIAPRPLLVETGARDPLNGQSGMKNVNSQMAITIQ